MLKKWKKCFGKRKVFGDLLIELSKSFDCLNHTLLTARLNAYTFNNPVLRLINDYLSNIKQRIKLDNTHITWIETVFGNTEGSILRHLLISINKNTTVKIGEYDIESSECEKLLGVKLDWKLKFNDHISDICKKNWLKTRCFRQNCTIYRIIQKT